MSKTVWVMRLRDSQKEKSEGATPLFSRPNALSRQMIKQQQQNTNYGLLVFNSVNIHGMSTLCKTQCQMQRGGINSNKVIKERTEGQNSNGGKSKRKSLNRVLSAV